MRFNGMALAMLVGLAATCAAAYLVARFVLTALVSFLVMAQ